MGIELAAVAGLAAAGLGVAASAGAFQDDVRPPPPPGRSDAEVEQARRDRIARARADRGTRSTILTSALEEEPSTAPATLLGQAGGR